MSHVGLLALILAVLVGFVLVVARPSATRAAPRIGATVEILALLALGLLPPVLLACAAATLGTASGSSGKEMVGLCVLASGPIGPIQLALYGLAVLLVARTGFLAARAIRATRRAELRGAALDGARPRRLRNGTTAWVVPSDRLAAYAGGFGHPRAVVSSGLLALLAPDEQEAVLAHEVAHVRLGHPRLFLLGGVLARSYAWLPPARLVWRRLRRELEAAADDEAVAAVGTAHLLSALAKVVLADVRPAGLGFAEPEDLRYRIARLQVPHRPRTRSTLLLGLAGALVAASLSWITCQALHADASWSSLFPCLAGLGYLGWRPTWRRTRGLVGSSS